jgi:hypothetical protein
MPSELQWVLVKLVCCTREIDVCQPARDCTENCPIRRVLEVRSRRKIIVSPTNSYCLQRNQYARYSRSICMLFTLISRRSQYTYMQRIQYKCSRDIRRRDNYNRFCEASGAATQPYWLFSSRRCSFSSTLPAWCTQ